MKFCYCPDCKDLGPTAWYRRKECKLCGKDCQIITVPISAYGVTMYALSAIGAALVVCEVFAIDLGLGTWRLYLMFGSLILAMVFSGLETGRAIEVAKERVGRTL
ncbi:MAG TPA: hypothetical protein PLJ11_08505 [Methanomassiliicoccales archaeon]|nr:hypothetical protein [Euryarchaeota archaeon]HOO04746.1 hypothetical protein [Methanomassiliicoccales archaeon]